MKREVTILVEDVTDEKNLTQKQLEFAREAFKVFDADGSGTITTDELIETLLTMGINLNEKQLSKIVSKADADGSGLIDFDEFILLIGDHIKAVCANQKSLIDLDESELYEAALAVFREFDDDGSGSISTVELGNVFRRLGADPSE